jgi:hypothetical protein
MTTGLPTGYKQFSLVVPKFSSRVKKGKNLYDLAFTFQNYGVGTRFTRSSWQYPEPCYWTVTSVRPTKNVRTPPPGPSSPLPFSPEVLIDLAPPPHFLCPSLSISSEIDKLLLWVRSRT